MKVAKDGLHGNLEEGAGEIARNPKWNEGKDELVACQRSFLKTVMLWHILSILLILLLTREANGLSPSQEAIEKKWVQSQGGVGDDEGEGEGGEYYLYYYDQEGEEGETTEEAMMAQMDREDEERKDRISFHFHLLSKLSTDKFISEAKGFCNCTTRDETLALFDHAIILAEVRQKEDEDKKFKKERREAQHQRQVQKEANLLQAKEESKKRDRERLEHLIDEQSKNAKPGRRITLKTLDFEFDQPPQPSMRYRASAAELEEDEDEIPEFMEPPEPSPLISAKQLLKLKKKYERYLERKAEDLLLEGPIVRADCEDLSCASCKVTVEEYVKSRSAAVRLEEFCAKRIGNLYEPITVAICDLIVQDPAAREALQSLDPTESLNDQRSKICVPLGFCDISDFLFEPEAIVSDDRSDKCLYCNSLIRDLEARVNLLTKVNPDVTHALVKNSCSLLSLPEEFQTHCTDIVKGTNIAKLSWSFKLYGENILRKDVRSKQPYPAKLCEELKLCEKLADLQKKPIVADAPFW